MQGGVATEAGIRNLGLRTGEESYLHYLPRHIAETETRDLTSATYSATVEVTML